MPCRHPKSKVIEAWRTRNISTSEALKISREVYKQAGKAEARLRAKCQWEHMSRTAVIKEWGDPRT